MNALKSIAGNTEQDLASKDIVDHALETVRRHLEMDVAYLSEFVDGQSVFRAVSAPGLEDLAKVGDTHSLDDVYCQHIVEGRLPELIPNTSDEPICQAMPITAAVPIGSHVSIPIRKKDGGIYGMFCCLSAKPNPSLNERDLDVMRVFSDLASNQINETIADRRVLEEKQKIIDEAINTQSFNIVLQPIYDLFANVPKGFETLCRFESDPYRSPDKWFDDARAVGRVVELEVVVIEKALQSLKSLPNDVYVSINASPETVVSDDLMKALKDQPVERIVLEVTEHAKVDNYDDLNKALKKLKKIGIKLAVDDAGAGYSSLQHILQLNPDLIKLDMSLTRNIDKDHSLRSLASALIFFARETGATIIAEGIETEAELKTLKALGITRGQGYFLGKPGPLAGAVSLAAEHSDMADRLTA